MIFNQPVSLSPINQQEQILYETAEKFFNNIQKTHGSYFFLLLVLLLVEIFSLLSFYTCAQIAIRDKYSPLKDTYFLNYMTSISLLFSFSTMLLVFVYVRKMLNSIINKYYEQVNMLFSDLIQNKFSWCFSVLFTLALIHLYVIQSSLVVSNNRNVWTGEPINDTINIHNTLTQVITLLCVIIIFCDLLKRSYDLHKQDCQQFSITSVIFDTILFIYMNSLCLSVVYSIFEQSDSAIQVYANVIKYILMLLFISADLIFILTLIYVTRKRYLSLKYSV